MLKIVVLLSVTIVSSNAFAQTRPVPIFTCHVNGKVAQVVRAGGVFVYRYGKPGAEPDIELRSTGKDVGFCSPVRPHSANFSNS